MTKLQNFFHTIFKFQTIKTSIFTLFVVALSAPLGAQTVDTVGARVYYTAVGASDSVSKRYCNGKDASGTAWTGDTDEKSFVYSPVPDSNRTGNDPWVSSALIEYDQPYPSPTVANAYPNHCLGLCAQYACSNLPVGQSTYSVAFPIQRVTFDIFKYYNGKNPKNADELPSIRSIDIYPAGQATAGRRTNYCGSYKCINAGWDSQSTPATCTGATYVYLREASDCNQASVGSCNIRTAECSGTCPLYNDAGAPIAWTACPTGSHIVWSMGAQQYRCHTCYIGPGNSDCLSFNWDGRLSVGTAYTEVKQSSVWHPNMSFCTGWDGSYEIAGEFGKTNGNFGFRATAYTNVPSDGIIADRIEISEMGVYPGHNGAVQIPIQIDVTNVHTVRSTPTLVGSITPVSAQPYTFTYRLSKDSDVRIAIFDASTLDNAAYAYASENGYNNSSNETSFAQVFDSDDDQDVTATAKIVRTLVDWQPRTGEGLKGVEKDAQISDFDSWDGRNDDGLLLPAGNYLASIQAKSQDEWKGIDFSRAVTRQVSLDPLKLTDVRTQGLTKKSTAYATISYVPTEPANVYWEVYTPGTNFTGYANNAQNGVSELLTNSSYPTGTGPNWNPATGSLVYRSQEQKTGRLNYTARWDGTCQVNGIIPSQRFIENGDNYPDGAVDKDGNSLTGGCGAAEGCTYYVKQEGCVRKYAFNEIMANGKRCTTSTGCQETYAYGAPMPDGNYVYVLWAEVPYNGCYTNAAGAREETVSGTTYYGEPFFSANTACTASAANNNKQFTGVKTLRYTVGNLEVERGLVGITVQPVTYATLGSSPTAYGLDPFIFKYALDRDAQVIATVENTAGVVVKHLTLEAGEPNVAQQLNTLSWDGRDDQGRMVYPGTYMFRVKAMDAMFPAQSNEAITVFPVDMYRIVDVSTTDVYGDSNAKATISYHLSKTMNTQVNIYNKDVVIPQYNNTTGEFQGMTASYAYGTGSADTTEANLQTVSITVGSDTFTPSDYGVTLPTSGSVTGINSNGTKRATFTVSDSGDPSKPYRVTVVLQTITSTANTTAQWPPRICDKTTDGGTNSIFYTSSDPEVTSGKAVAGAVNPAKVNQYQAACIYVNDPFFAAYPNTATLASSSPVNVRLQPIKQFNRTKLSYGDNAMNMEEWDALYFYNPNPSETKYTPAEIYKCKNSTEISDCPYEMVPDGQYPFYIAARSNEPFNRYYYDAAVDANKVMPTDTVTYGSTYTISGQPFIKSSHTVQMPYLYASDKVVSKINVTRGPVYFLEDSVAVFPNAPQLFNASSTTLTFIPPYEINFSISRAATVEVAIVALQPGMCSPVTTGVLSSTVNAQDFTTVTASRTNAAGDICKFLSTMTIMNTGNFDANAVRKMYWDGTDHNGNYVKPGIYEVRLTAKNYPNPGLYDPTVKSITLNADLLKVFDLVEADNYAISTRNTDMKIGYQLSVPMKVGIQIFKPGTTIYDYSKGTLRNPTTGQEVQDIREVLVRAITGIRPGTTLIEEVWDGRDYAQQEVPDGVYPFRFVTSLDSAAIDSVTGEIVFGSDAVGSTDLKINYVADTYEYQNLHKATIAIGDGRFVCEDWKKTVFFYPNPLRDASKGTLEITKMPVPGTVSIKYFNLAGDLVRDSDYTCVDANNYQTTMGSSLYFQPDNNVSTTKVDLNEINNVRNAAMRCKWDRTNQHGKKVARGVYFGLVDFKAYNGREHCQKVVKILIP